MLDSVNVIFTREKQDFAISYKQHKALKFTIHWKDSVKLLNTEVFCLDELNIFYGEHHQRHECIHIEKKSFEDRRKKRREESLINEVERNTITVSILVTHINKKFQPFSTTHDGQKTKEVVLFVWAGSTEEPPADDVLEDSSSSSSSGSFSVVRRLLTRLSSGRSPLIFSPQSFFVFGVALNENLKSDHLTVPSKAIMSTPAIWPPQ